MRKFALLFLAFQNAFSDQVWDETNGDLVKAGSPAGGDERNRLAVVTAGDSLQLNCKLIATPGNLSFSAADTLETEVGDQETATAAGVRVISRTLVINNIRASSDGSVILCQSGQGNIQATLQVFEKIVDVPKASCEKSKCQDAVTVTFRQESEQSIEPKVLERIRDKTETDENLSLQRKLYDILYDDRQGDQTGTVFKIDGNVTNKSLYEECKCKRQGGFNGGLIGVGAGVAVSMGAAFAVVRKKYRYS